MTYFPPISKLDRARGSQPRIADPDLVGGQTVVQKFGRNPDVGTTAFEHIWFNGGGYNWLTGSSELRIQAGGDAADTAAGAGAREIQIEGLDENWDEATELVTTAGASASTETTTKFIRVNRAFVTAVGVYSGSNVDDIKVESVTGSLIVANIEAGLGQTQLGHFSVPNGKSAYLTRITAYYSSNKDGTIRCYRREGADVTTAPFGPDRVIYTWDEVSGEVGHQFDSYPCIPGKSDIYFVAQANNQAASVDVSFDMIIVNDD